MKITSTGKLNFEVPTIEESTYDGWVEFGEDNLYPQELLNLYNEAPLHSALCQGIAQRIVGDGIEITNAEEYPEEAKKFEIWSGSVNPDGQTLLEIVQLCAMDLKIHGYFYIEAIMNQTKTKLNEIYHVPAQKVRSGKYNGKRTVQEFYISNDWSNTTEHEPQPIPSATNDTNKGKFLMRYGLKNPTSDYYSFPDYQGSINYVIADKELSAFRMENISKRFVPKALVQLFGGEPTDDAKRQFERKFEDLFTGTDAKNFVMIFSDNDQEQRIRVESFTPANLDALFTETSENVKEYLMFGHRMVSPQLIGIRDGSGLASNAEELKNATLILQEVTIKPFQNIILKMLSDIASKKGFGMLEIGIEPLIPADFGADAAEINEEEEAVQMTRAEKFTEETEDDRELMSDEMQRSVLRRLSEVGEEITPDYEIIHVEDTETASDEELVSRYEFGLIDRVRFWMERFNNKIKSDPNKQSDADEPLVKLRYIYVGPRDDKNRDFCAEVLDKNLLYRKEDIDQMSFAGANEEFGTYNIFQYKGSYNCRHRWKRVILKRKFSKRGNARPETVKNTGSGTQPNYEKGAGAPPKPINDKQARKKNKPVKA